MIGRRLTPRQLEQAVAGIHERGRELRGIDAAKLKRVTGTLRERLLRHGRGEDLAWRSFALVREVAERTLGMRHHDVQVAGGLAMWRGDPITHR